jgi:hypothetical protein
LARREIKMSNEIRWSYADADRLRELDALVDDGVKLSDEVAAEHSDLLNRENEAFVARHED